MVKYVAHDDVKTGHFESPLPLKPFDPNSIRGNRLTANKQNKAMLKRIQKYKESMAKVKKEMEKFMEQGFIKRLKDLPK